MRNELDSNGLNESRDIDAETEQITAIENELKPASFLQRLTAIQVSDEGETQSGLRYTVEAIELHPTDTMRAATVHIASCYSKETADLIVEALTALKEAK